MLLKAAWFNDFSSFMKIRASNGPSHAKALGKDVANFTNEEWFKILPSVAVEVAWQKYTKTRDGGQARVFVTKVTCHDGPYFA